MQVLDIQYLRSVNFLKNTQPMHYLKTNFDKNLPIGNETLADQLNSDGNLQYYPNKPNWPKSHLMALALLQEALDIDSEHWFWGKLHTKIASVNLLQYINFQTDQPINLNRKTRSGAI